MNSFRCGYIALIGRPNVGKSTLLNQLIGQKISITAPKPQTTRHRVIGVKTAECAQYVYIDTPGIHAGDSRALHRYLNRAARSVLPDMHVLVMLIEAGKWQRDDDLVLSALDALTIPVVLAINKIDRLDDKAALLPFIGEVSQKYPFKEIVPVSALKAIQLAALEQAIDAFLPANAAFYPEDALTDKSERFIAAEFIREKLVRNLVDELPYATSVEIDLFEDSDSLLKLHATIWVERENQKPIVIGKQGAMLKRIGNQARKDLEQFFGKRVFLETWVKVKRGWSDDERALRQLGYGHESE